MPADTVHDAQFGTLDWDEDMDWWSAACTLPSGQAIAVYVTPDDDSDTISPASRAAFTRIIQDPAGIARYAADELLEDRNSVLPPISQSEFIRHLILREISLQPDGSAGVSFSDSGMYGNHAIIVELEPDGSGWSAHIEG